MEQQQTLTPPPASLPTTVAPPITTTTTYPESLDSSPRSRNTDSWGEDNSLYPTNHNGNVTNTQQQPPPPHHQQPPVLAKLRLMCSYGGHIVPRPHDKSLCYVGGDTRIVVVDRHTTLSDLTHRLSKTLLRSSSSTSNVTAPTPSNIPSTGTASFMLKYQLPSEDLDSLISVTTDEDLENMIEEYERLNNSADVSKSSRLRLFLFPMKPESDSSIGSLLENSTKSEDWFLNALNGTTSGFSDTSSVNCLLGLDDDVLVNDKEKEKERKEIGIGGKSAKGNNSGQDIHSVPDLERSSSFGSASSSPSLASLPPIKVHVEDNLNQNQKVGGIEEQFSQMSVQQQQKVLDDGGYVSAVAPVANVVVAGVPLPAQVEYSNQQKQAMGFDMTSPDSVSSDGRQKPAMIYQDPLVQIQASNINNRTGDVNNSNVQDQNARMQMQQQQQQQQQQHQQMADSGYLMSMSNNQVDQQHSQMHHQQPQFIHTAVPQPQYIHHHPSGAVPMASYYQMYPSQNQHQPVPPQLDQQNFVYYMPAPARQAPHGYNVQKQQQSTGYAEVSSAAGAATPLSHNQAPPSAYSTNRPGQTTPKSELPAGVYGTANSGGSQFVQVPSSQHQHQPQLQPQYVGYSQMHPSQSVANSASGGGGGNYGYEFADPAQGQHIYYAAQPLPPHSGAQYQTVTGEAGSYLPTDNSTKQQQQGRTQQP